MEERGPVRAALERGWSATRAGVSRVGVEVDRRHEMRGGPVTGWPAAGHSEPLGRGRAVALGLLFGLCSLPVVAWWLLRPPSGWQHMTAHYPHLGEVPLAPGDALLLSAIPVFAASLAGSIIGGLRVRRDPVVASLLAVAASWAAGFVVLTVAADAQGIALEGQFLLEGTMKEAPRSTPSPYVAGPVDQALLYLGSVAVGAAFTFPVVLLLLAAATRLRRRGWWFVGSLAVIGAFATVHWITIVSGIVPFACLAVGVLAWTAILHDRRAASREGAQPLGDPPWPVAIRIPRAEPRWTIAGASWSTPRLSVGEQLAETIADQPPIPGFEWLEDDRDLPPLPRRALEPTSEATLWEVESGALPGCSPGVRVWIESDGTIMVIARPGIGVVAALACERVTREEAGGILVIRDAERGVDVRLHAVEH
jgi:hypothetical protein